MMSVVKDLQAIDSILKKLEMRGDLSAVTDFNDTAIVEFRKTLHRVLQRYKRECDRTNRYRNRQKKVK